METWDAIRSRRDVRAYSGRAIDSAHLDQILEAGRRTPSSLNAQRWRFVVVEDRSRLEKLAAVWRNARHVASAAAAVAIVAPVTGDRHTMESIQYDLGQATTAMMIAAADLGVGSAHAAVEDWALGAEILGIPPDWRLEWMLSLGYPADRPLRPILRPNRLPFDEVVRREHW